MLRAMAKAAYSAWWVFAVLACADAGGVDCHVLKSGGAAYTTCLVNVRSETLRIFHSDAQGKPYGSFERLRASLATEKRELLFAVNGGMFHPDYRPVGLLVIDGRELAPVNRSSGFGNFFLQPNGVFLVDNIGARVVATEDYRDYRPELATQSGPMLVHRGRIPDLAEFAASSHSRHVRNGVCAPRADQALFVISDDEVTFREFAVFLRYVLGCSEALYLDGTVSSLFAPSLQRADARAALGPILAVVR